MLPRDINFSVSGRVFKENLKNSVDARFHDFKNVGTLESVFGSFLVDSKLYGGRLKPNIITEKQLKYLYNKGINASIVLSNYFFSGKLENSDKFLLEELHVEGNSVVVANDELALCIKSKYPKYKLRASATKLISTNEEIDQLLALYDYVVLLPHENDNNILLSNIKQKNKVVLFANARCAYTCRSHICYENISNMILNGDKNDNKKGCQKYKFSGTTKYFNIKDYISKGFCNFKLINT